MTDSYFRPTGLEKRVSIINPLAMSEKDLFGDSFNLGLKSDLASSVGTMTADGHTIAPNRSGGLAGLSLTNISQSSVGTMELESAGMPTMRKTFSTKVTLNAMV